MDVPVTRRRTNAIAFKKYYFMATNRPVSFANFICKFGEETNLLDVAEQIILPAFLKSNEFRPRSFSDTRYFFHEPSLVNLGTESAPQLVIAGRLIKDTTLRREQIFSEEKGLIRTLGSLESSPSAIFVLILNNHKLVYCPETAHAPSLASFRSTAYSYIRQAQNKFIKDTYEDLNARREAEIEQGLNPSPKVTKKDLWDTYPIPTLDVVPIPSDLSLAEFVRRYSRLTSISLRVLQTNSELDNSKLIDAARTTGTKLGATNTQVTHSAGNKQEGLNRTEAVSQLRAVATTGNVEVKLSGIDQSGNKLVGNNEEFKLRVYVESVSRNIKTAAAELVGALDREIKSNNIRLAVDADASGTMRRIKNIFKAWNG